MALLLKRLYQGYNWLFTDITDKRCDGFFLMSSPLQPILLMVLYLQFVLNWGPKLMKNRQPFNLDLVLKVFNFVQILTNTFLAYHATKEVLFNLNWACSPVDYSNDPHTLFVLKLVYLYFWVKVADLFDTVFFVLRKKERNISFLHVYHHFGMIAVVWIAFKFFAGGHSIYLGWANSIVHAILYFYYLLTIWKPEYRNSLWWKKYITQLQLVQFVFFFFIYGQLLAFRPDCPYPKVACYFIVPQSVFMIFLFSDFYYKSYIKGRK